MTEIVREAMAANGADAILNEEVACRCRGGNIMIRPGASPPDAVGIPVLQGGEDVKCGAVEPGCAPAQSFDDAGQDDGWSARALHACGGPECSVRI